MSQQNKTPKQDKIANSSKDANKISEKETKHIKDSKPSKSTPKQDQSKSTKSTNEKSDETQLFALVETGQLQDFIDLMSTKEINVSRLTDELKRTVLHIAVLKGHIRVIKYLLTLDSDPCDPNAVDQHKQSVLHYAAHTGDSDVFNILKEHDVNFNCKDVFGRTALHHAAMHGSVSSVQWLVDNSLSKRDTLMHWINQKDMLGSNALHWAAVKGKHDVVKFLVARGINVHLRAGNSWTAAGLAEQALKDQVHNWLRHYITYGNNLMKYVTNRLKGGSPPKDSSTSSNSVSANGRNKEETARDLRQEARRETLLDVRNNLSAHVKAFDKWKTTERADGSFIQFYRNRHGMTALHMAAKYGDFLIVSELIHTHKFCLSSTDYYGRTPLHYAALYGHTSTALLLTHISRGYREEDTYRHFVAGDYTNGLSSSTSEGQNDDDDYDTDVRVSHWKLKTATNLLPSQMAQHGHLHHVHYDSLLSQRLSFSETDHKKSMDIYKSKKDDSYSNETKHNGNNGNSGTCSSSSMITDEMSKARRQLMPGFEEENNGELNNSSNGSSGVGSVGSGNGKGNSNSNNSGSSGTSSNNIGAVNDDNKGGTATSTTTVTTTTTTTTPDDTKEVVGGGDTKSNHDRSSEDITKSVTVIDEAAPVTNGDDQVRNRAADRSLSGGSFPEKDVTSDTSDQDTKREDESGRQDVYNWLEKAGLAQYTEKFLENGWETTDALILLEKTNLEQMGVLPGHCAVILKNIQERKGLEEYSTSNVMVEGDVRTDRTLKNSSASLLERTSLQFPQESNEENTQHDSTNATLTNIPPHQPVSAVGKPILNIDPNVVSLPPADTIMSNGDLMSSVASIDSDSSSPGSLDVRPISRSNSSENPSSQLHSTKGQLSRSSSNSLNEPEQAAIKRFNNNDLNFAATSAGDSSFSVSERAFVHATLNGIAVVFKNITSKMLVKITEKEQQLLRVNATSILPYLAICIDPPSFVTLRMPNGGMDDWLYGARSKRRKTVTTTVVDNNENSVGKGGNDDEEKKEIEAESNNTVDEFVISDLQVAKWAVQLASAISHLHTEQIIHGDIRCGNVLLDDKMDIKLSGFLISEPVEDYSLASSCLHWEAPEAFRHEIKEYTKNSDAYMLALTLYEMVVRGKPWGELTGKEVREKILENNERPDIQPLDDWIKRRPGSDAMKSIIEKCWANDPSSRIEVWQIWDILKQMQLDCETMDQRQKKKEEEEASVEVVGRDEKGKSKEEKEKKTTGENVKMRPHSYPPPNNRRASSPANITGGSNI